MDKYPALNIHFPPAREPELHKEMVQRARLPWSPKQTDALGRPPARGHVYFHRDLVNDEPSCTVCIAPRCEGHWVVENIVPDEGQGSQIPLETYVAILDQFDALIAGPAAESVEGITTRELSHYRLEDHFSVNAVALLKLFCESSNQGDLGSHPSDQRKWMNFLLAAYDENRVHCDIFGACLRNAKCWPDHGIPRLVQEYDFAMRLLTESGRKRSSEMGKRE